MDDARKNDAAKLWFYIWKVKESKFDAITMTSGLKL